MAILSALLSIKAKLDLFHTMQRVVQTLSKGTEWSTQITKEFRLVFRDNGDCGEMRNLPTSEPHVLKRNLDNLVKRWDGTPNKENQQKNFQRVGKHKSMLRKAAFLESILDKGQSATTPSSNIK